MTKVFSPFHLPKGTVIKTSLYEIDENAEIRFNMGVGLPGSKAVAATFVVDYVQLVDTMCGANILVVTTTPNPRPLYSGDIFYHFNISHVSSIVSVGKKVDIRYNHNAIIRSSDLVGKDLYREYQLQGLLISCLTSRQPLAVFDIDRAIALGKKNKIFMPVRDTESNSYMYDVVYRVNKKKMKAWIKQNINRFLKTNKEIKREIEERNRQYYEDFCDNEV